MLNEQEAWAKVSSQVSDLTGGPDFPTGESFIKLWQEERIR